MFFDTWVGITYNTTMEPIQIVLDTNILSAALRSNLGASFQLISLIDKGQFEINLSVALVLEYESVLLRQRHLFGLTQTDIEIFLDYLCKVGHCHDIYFLWRPYLPDPKDEMVLEVAVRANCSQIITYNRQDFRNIDRFGVEALTAQEFLNSIRRNL